MNFNSHAHVERDMMNEHFASGLTNISTHTLTWSVTTCRIYQLINVHISTHTLTWSVTRRKRSRNSRERFQLTRSRGAWHHPLIFVFLRLSFQLTRSRGAWHYMIKSAKKWYIFQLTRSRGAWPKWAWVKFQILNISTHTLTWSVTILKLISDVRTMNFNSHAHVERDLRKTKNWLQISGFQLTRSRGAWPFRQRRKILN